MAKQTFFCPAKVNLFLEILEKRPDGYHEIDSIMQSVSLCDQVTVETYIGKGEIRFSCTDSSLPTDERNLAYRAAKLYMEKGKITNMDLNISLVKQIPIAAGLAGGSTDAAGVLSALQSLFGSFKKEELLDLARSLGADVPFCLMQGCARARGIGEELTKLPSLSPEYFFVIAKGGEGVSTKDAYQLADSYPQKKSAQAMEEALCRGEADVVLQGFYNAFERAVLPIRPMAALAKEVMFREGAIAALMSGSGPSVFGIFVDQEKAEKVRHSLSLQGYQAFVASPIL